VKLGFSMPHMVRLKATSQPWEASVTGADQTMSSVPIPKVEHIEDYFDYTQWVAEEIMPAVAS
jgi:hypothetical protein